ncbi:NucA/NucB deoxyribonuclease domain-containing protein [Streptomyces sp. NBC_00467]|uniref:NucA/NucB deoxyribonuclease domain-containing protein n=1 Tax=Streptomyces sp. NBC_00467 TaxID=2975752 RepID=UPI002E19339E
MTSPRTRWVLPALLLTVALTATGTAGAADGQAAPARSPLTGAADETADGVSAAPATTVQSAAFAAEDFCSRLPAGARTAAPDAVTACVSVDSGTGTATRTKTAAPTPATADLAADDPAGDGIGTEFEPDADDPEPPAPSCALTNQGNWTWSRTGGMCLNGVEVTYTLYDANGKTIGTGLVQVDSTLATSYKSLDLNETITARLVRVTGDVKSLVVKMQVDCGAGCKTVTKQPWYGSTAMTPGTERTGKTKYSGDAFAAGTTRSSFRTSYKMYVTMPGAVPVDPSASWSSPATGEIRCDKEQPRLRGCVIPTDDIPVLSYSSAHEKYGIVVPIYEEIMKRRGTDILHAVNQTKANANRASTCTPFTSLYPGQTGKDSCDEFPPASTEEGGQDGDLCAELTPQVVNGLWSAPATWPTRPASGNETCLRLHITQRANSSAGGVLGSLRKYQRLVDGDPFRIEFTA